MTPKSAAPTSPAPRPYSAGRPKWSLKRASGKPFAISRPSWNSLTVSEVKGRSDLRGINRAQAQPTGQQEIEKSGADVTEWTPREVARRAEHTGRHLFGAPLNTGRVWYLCHHRFYSRFPDGI